MVTKCCIEQQTVQLTKDEVNLIATCALFGPLRENGIPRNKILIISVDKDDLLLLSRDWIRTELRLWGRVRFCYELSNC